MSELTREQLGLTLNNAVDHGMVDDEDYKIIMAHDAALRQRIEELEQQLQLREIPSRLHTQALIEESTRVVQQQNVTFTAKVAEVERERAIAKCGEQLCGHDHSTQYWELRANKAEMLVLEGREAVEHYMEESATLQRKLAASEAVNERSTTNALKQIHDLEKIIVASEARVAKLEEALKVLVDVFAGTTKGKRYQSRYEHGGGRLFVDEGNILGHARQLIADTYAEGDREFIYLCYETLAALSQDGVGKE